MVDHPPADRIVASGEMVGVVGVEAFDPDSGAADAATRPGTLVVLRQLCVALGGVAIVRRLEGVGVDVGLGTANPAGPFQATDQEAVAGADQPVPGGHRSAVVEYRCVADHPGRAGSVADHDLEVTLG